MWEVVSSALKGKYHQPYGEYENIQFDFQIIIQVSKNFLRPTFDAQFPQELKEMIVACWDANPSNRLSLKTVIEKLSGMKESFKEIK